MGKRKHHGAGRRPPVRYHVVHEGAATPGAGEQQGLVARFYWGTGWATKLLCVLAVMLLIVAAVRTALAAGDKDMMRKMTDLARCKATCVSMYLSGRSVISDEECKAEFSCNSCWTMCDKENLPASYHPNGESPCLSTIACGKGCRTACDFMASPPYTNNNVDPDVSLWQFKKHPTMTYQKPDVVTVRYDAVDPGPRGAISKTAVYMFLVITHDIGGYVLAGITANDKGIKLKLPYEKPGFQLMMWAITPHGMAAGLSPRLTRESQFTSGEQFATIQEVTTAMDINALYKLSGAGESFKKLVEGHAKSLQKLEEQTEKMFNDFKELLSDFEEEDSGKDAQQRVKNMSQKDLKIPKLDIRRNKAAEGSSIKLKSKSRDTRTNMEQPAAVVSVTKDNTLVYTE